MQGMKTVFCSELDDNGFQWVADKIRGRVGTGPVYLSLDIDVADPAFAPGTGTPEASGILTLGVVGLLSRRTPFLWLARFGFPRLGIAP